MTRNPNVSFSHHSSLIDGSIFITPFFELEPAAFHVDIVHTSNDGQTFILVFSGKINKDQSSSPHGPGRRCIPSGRRGRLLHIQPVSKNRQETLTEKPCTANARLNSTNSANKTPYTFSRSKSLKSLGEIMVNEKRRAMHRLKGKTKSCTLSYVF
jgi:hypothetical protein